MADVGIGDIFHIIHVSIIEPMAPSKHVEGWEVMPVGRFWQKFGSHWHSLAWYCRETGAIWDRLEPRGVRMVTDGGNPLNGRPTGEHHTILADPQKTFGAQFRFTTWDVPGDPRN